MNQNSMEKHLISERTLIIFYFPSQKPCYESQRKWFGVLAQKLGNASSQKMLTIMSQIDKGLGYSQWGGWKEFHPGGSMVSKICEEQ